MFPIFFISWILICNKHLLVQTAAINTNDTQTELVTNNIAPIEDTTVAQLTTIAFLETTAEIEEPSSSTDDVIELNVGGQKITTLRSTLTVIPQSKLARMFSKDNVETNLVTDKQGSVFFDYNPLYFSYLLDQLRAIKRMPKTTHHQVQFQAPYMGSHMNFTHMLVDLGLTRTFYSKTCNRQTEMIKGNKFLTDDFLSPREGTHINLTISSLAGWTECYHSTYDVPFNFSVLKNSCNGSQLLVACRPVANKKTLTLAAIGQYEDVFHPCLPTECKTNEKGKKKKKKLSCSSNYQCMTQAKRGVGWYNANNQTLGFVRGSLSFAVDPCDSSNLDSDYRLCWTAQPIMKKTSGDRCGSTLNLQNSTKWERLIYYTA